jgi:RNA polymerase sigma factor (sigma-70 family)
MKNSFNIIFKDYLKKTHLPSKELTALVKQYLKCKDKIKKENIKDAIFTNSIKLIIKATLEHTSHQSRDFIEDAFQTACIEFFKGLEKYNPEEKVEFVTYIYYWIVKGLINEFHSREIIRVPRDRYKDEEFKALRNSGLVYYDKPITETEKTPIRDFLVDKNGVLRDEDKEKKLKFNHIVDVAKDILGDVEFCVFKLRFCYDNEISCADIGSHINIGYERVRQIERMSLHKIKCALRGKPYVTKYRCSKVVAKNPDEIYAMILKNKS